MINVEGYNMLNSIQQMLRHNSFYQELYSWLQVQRPRCLSSVFGLH